MALSVLLYEGILIATSALAAPLGLAGGFLYGFVSAACLSGYLHLLGRAVDKSRLSWDDLRQGFLALLWDVMGLLFALWIVGTVVDMIAKNAGDHALFVQAAYALTLFVLLNPMPELISQRRGGGGTTALLSVSVQFVQQHWIEWFLPQLVLVPIGAVLWSALSQGSSLGSLMMTALGLADRGGPSLLWGLLALVPLLAALHYFMIFRGLLFQELATGGWRARAFRTRTRAR